jgi:hypothetical protein
VRRLELQALLGRHGLPEIRAGARPGG